MKLKKGVIRSLIFGILVLGIFLVSLNFVSAFSGLGEGTAASPYNITNCTQLQEMKDDLTAYYQLNQSIDCSDTVNWNSGAGFEPIGEISNPPNSGFSGSFNGNNFNITGLNINRSDTNYVGLFGYVCSMMGNMSNVGLIDVNITGNSYVGGLVGYSNYGNILNSFVTGNVEGISSYLGGLVGYFEIGNISNSFVIVNITGNNYVGGFAGFTYSSITNSYSIGNVTTTGDNVGGFVGINSGAISNSNTSVMVEGANLVGGFVGSNSYFGVDYSLLITNSFATGNVTGTGDFVGGFVGDYDAGEIYNSSSIGNVIGNNYVGGLIGDCSYTVYDSFATGNVTGTGDYVGGLIGYSSGEGNEIVRSNSTGEVTGDDYVGGLIGYSMGTIVRNSFASGNVTGDDYVGGLLGKMYISEIHSSYTIGNVNGTSYVGGLVGYFSSITINNSYVTGNVNGTSYVGGLVGYIYFGEDYNSIISNSYTTGNVESGNEEGVSGAGGLVGYTEYFCDDETCYTIQISNSSAIGNVTGTGDYVGGLAGLLVESCYVNYSYATGDVTGNNIVGGLVGKNYYSNISNSYATGNVNATVENAGGLVGYNYHGDIYNSTAFGGVIGGYSVGGFVGLSYYGSIYNSSASGNVNGTTIYAGGFVGQNLHCTIYDSSASGNVKGHENVGGFVGFNDEDISNSYATGNVNATGENAGGFIGRNYGNITISYAIGNVSGSDDVGGFIGENNAGAVYSSFSTGNVTATGSYVGGFIGYDELSHYNSGWVIINGLNAIGNPAGNLTYNEESVSAFYDYSNGVYKSGNYTWDFSSIWSNVYYGTDYPVLYWQNASTNDTDNDYTPDVLDKLWYNESNVNTTGIDNLNITVGGNSTSNSYSLGEYEVRFYNSSTLLVNFTHNFTANELDLSKVKIIKADNSLIINLSGQLQSNYNKTIYITDNSFIALCVKDMEIASIDEMTSGCNGANETDLTSCLGGSYSANGINCTDEGTTIKIENLRYSAVRGTPATAPATGTDSPASSSSGSGGCLTNWTCSQWGSCINEIQTRNCTKEKSYCYADIKKKPVEIQNCSVNSEGSGSENNNNVDDSPKTISRLNSIKDNKYLFLIILLIIGIFLFLVLHKHHRKKRRLK